VDPQFEGVQKKDKKKTSKKDHHWLAGIEHFFVMTDRLIMAPFPTENIIE